MPHRFAIAVLPLLATAAPAAAAPARETAVLAGGCFWGMEAVFEHVRGVTDVVSGYAGGSARDATYAAVSTERTGHAEAVRITYDPRQVSYGQLLAIFARVAHDPTQLNRQGPDTGPSYRSAIFPQNPAQAAAARAFLASLRASGRFRQPVVTRIENGSFTPAEAAHQDFARRYPSHPYIVVNDRPKVAALKRRYPAFFRG
ncbi:peptide-methionine (S)-S-oxide reductase MsrA [Sphingomonas sp. BN140010]|uniref:Peptide methionine sulfoxide reductase MsrA n=1 Tax=Sphingomonas arvum TaxID=2992113 RepID=A0ABT3JB67_9SPHN|nr:peptide-methionine (S)-S-oxide reductase MsrA [Sphingomonas sp. BN140010]MCW3796311.1 peptide-methionine (S)-S-oxide reductase MsrA [Sphingomonas sp. BN140010]